MRVLGVDPGLSETGWAVVEKAGAAPERLLASGLIATEAGEPLGPRLRRVHEALLELLSAHAPDGLAQTLRQWVGEQIGPIARPRDVYIVGELPKTRSGKIMRRLLRDVAEGREVGDTTTLADTAVMSVISAQVR